MTAEGEFPRTFDVRQCEGKQVHLTANEAERAALAKRFDIVRVDRLEADLVLTRHDRDGEEMDARTPQGIPERASAFELRRICLEMSVDVRSLLSWKRDRNCCHHRHCRTLLILNA